jgi:hypothetical protein
MSRIPTEGPGSTYVVMVVPFDEQVFADDEDQQVGSGSAIGARASTDPPRCGSTRSPIPR